MKIPRTVNVVGNIDDDLIAGADINKNTIATQRLIRIGTIAAVFVIFVVVGIAFIPKFNSSKSEGDGRYKDYSLLSSDSSIIWPWEYKTISERFTNLIINGTPYSIRGRARGIPESLIGEKLGIYPIEGVDWTNDEKHTTEADVYSILNIAKEQFVAVKLDDTYYAFMKDEFDPPTTYGELLDTINLPAIVELKQFQEYNGYDGSRFFLLEDDTYIWEILEDCRSAKFVQDDWWNVSAKEYISFAFNSEAMDIQNLALYITKDGFLWTNAFGWQYLFDIGKDASEKILNYVKSNSYETEYVSPVHYVAGTIVEISDSYFIVDDSVLCKKSEDGIKYKILLNDIRISRYIDKSVIKMGDIVQISCDKEPGTDIDNTVDSAYYAAKVYISEGDLYTNE